ncbi:MAG: DUF4384 domain-containing protein [Deltaproteobacteria bacterium]|nr:MAG: DUF4384 domain-containing protein [Deltaproteobacteria bacterium]
MESLSTWLEHAREEHHPSRTQWDLYLLESLSVPEQENLEHHLTACPRCEQQLDELRVERNLFVETMDVDGFLSKLSALASAPSIAEPEPEVDLIHSGAFAPSVQALRDHVEEQQFHPETSQAIERPSVEKPATSLWERLSLMLQSLLRPVVWGPLGACALVLVFVFQSNNGLTPGGQNPGACLALDDSDHGVRRKGSPEMQVFLFRDGQRMVARSKDLYRAGDILALRYKSSSFRYLTVVYLDNKGEMGWLYPQAPGQSIPITAQGDLKDSVQLDQAKGTERLLAFFSKKPLQVSAVKRLAREKLKPGYLSQSCELSNIIFLHELVLHKR